MEIDRVYDTVKRKMWQGSQARGGRRTMATLTETIQSVIDDINTAIKFARPLASGDPIPDSTIYESGLKTFPTVDRQAQEAYDMAVKDDDEEKRDQAQVLIEASERMAALYTMLCDLIPARDSRDYDFYTTSMVLPYLIYTLDALADIVDDLNAELVMLGAAPAPVKLSDNVMFIRAASFVADSLLPYSRKKKKIAGFRTYAIQQLRKFCYGEEAEAFEFSFSDGTSALACSFDGDIFEMINTNKDDGLVWNWAIGRNGDATGSIDSGDLENLDGKKLAIVAPDEYCYEE